MRKAKQNKRLNDKKVGFTNGNHMKYVEKKNTMSQTLLECLYEEMK